MTDDVNSEDKDQGLLTTVAESIGTALGSIAAKASAAQKSIGKSTAAAVLKSYAIKTQIASQENLKIIQKIQSPLQFEKAQAGG